jgi:hypothetical protein
MRGDMSRTQIASRKNRPLFQSLPAGQRLQDRIQDGIEVLANIFRKEAQNKIAILLQQAVLSAIATIGSGVRKMLRAVEFNGNSKSLVQEVDLHLTLPIERDRNSDVQLEPVFCLGNSFKTAIEKRFARTARLCQTRQFRR